MKETNWQSRTRKERQDPLSCQCSIQPGMAGAISYAIKQVAPIIVEEADAIVVITVYTFYF